MKPPLFGEAPARLCTRWLGDRNCGALPVMHVLWDAETMENGVVCGEHVGELGSRWEYAQAHELGPDCGMPNSGWHFADNVCRCPEVLTTSDRTPTETLVLAAVAAPEASSKEQQLGGGAAARSGGGKPEPDEAQRQAQWLLDHWTAPAFGRPPMQEKALMLARTVLAGRPDTTLSERLGDGDLNAGCDVEPVVAPSRSLSVAPDTETPA